MNDDNKTHATKRMVSPYQALLQALYECILITDLQGKVEDVNPRSGELFGRPSDEICGRRLPELVSGFDDAILNSVVESLSTQKHILIEASCLKGDGSLIPVEIAANRLLLNDGDHLCFSIRDISARTQAEGKLEEAREELMRMEKITTRMETITTLAHEINNPLQMLMSMVEDDRNVRYAAPLNRVVAVMQEMRREEELKRIKYAGEAYRFELLGPDVARSAPKHILIVDDEPTLVKFFQAVLQSEFPDLVIDVAGNGQQAVSMFQVKHHAVLLLDIAMPIMNGEEAFHEIRRVCKEKKWEMPAVIFCTGYTPPDSIREAIAKDSLHGYLPKPVARESIVNAVRNRFEYYDLCHGRTGA